MPLPWLIGAAAVAVAAAVLSDDDKSKKSSGSDEDEVRRRAERERQEKELARQEKQAIKKANEYMNEQAELLTNILVPYGIKEGGIVWGKSGDEYAHLQITDGVVTLGGSVKVADVVAMLAMNDALSMGSDSFSMSFEQYYPDYDDLSENKKTNVSGEVFKYINGTQNKMKQIFELNFDLKYVTDDDLNEIKALDNEISKIFKILVAERKED